MPTPFSLLADTPAWTHKELLIAVGSVIAALIPVCLFVVRILNGAQIRRAKELSKRNSGLQAKIESLQEKISDLRKGSDAPFADTFETHELESQVEKLQGIADNLQSKLSQADSHADQSKATLDTIKKSLDEHQAELGATKNRIARALKNEGPIWTEKVRSDTPEFKPLMDDGRRMPIVSILNLKGGVGKTTIAANLGGCLDARGFRALMLDLDLQGSLTSIFLSEKVQTDLRKARRVLGEFLNRSFDAEFPNLLHFSQPILADGKSALVPTADDLAYAEMNLSVRWLLREGNRDPRFLLRRELHLKRIANAYDIVLLDCPPILNIFCVNAIAASDYLLIPVLPSEQSTSRVPVLLNLLKDFRQHINPHIKVLGIVCNRTFRAQPTEDELNRFRYMRQDCKDVWGEEVPQFETQIKQSTEIRLVEDERRPLALSDRMYESFAALAGELTDRLPAFCNPVQREKKATVPA
jgi:cellulose biosynthesis protein BcsQ